MSDTNGYYDGPLTGHVVELVHPTGGTFMLKEIDEIRDLDQFMSFDDIGGKYVFQHGFHDATHDFEGFFLSDKGKLYLSFNQAADEDTPPKFIYHGKDVTQSMYQAVNAINNTKKKIFKMTIQEFDISPKNGGFVGYEPNNLFYLRIDE